MLAHFENTHNQIHLTVIHRNLIHLTVHWSQQTSPMHSIFVVARVPGSSNPRMVAIVVKNNWPRSGLEYGQ